MINVSRNHFCERFRQRAGNGIERRFATPTVAFEDDQLARHQAVDGADHHEGITTGRLMDGGGKFGQAFRAESCIDVSRHVLERQATERQHRGAWRRGCKCRQPLVSALACGPFPIATGADDQQLRRDLTFCQAHERVDGVGVSPLEIFEDEDERQIERQRGECGAQLVEHPDGMNGRRSRSTPLRKLRQPGGRVRGKLSRHVSRMPTIEGDERVQEYVVRFVGQLAVERLTVTDTHRAPGVGRSHEGITQCGLPSPVLARYQHEAACRGADRIERVCQRGQLRAAVDENRRAHLTSGLESARLACFRYVGNKRIAAPRR